MAGVWRKSMQCLGLVEDQEFDDIDEEMEAVGHPDTVPVRRVRGPDVAVVERPEAIIRTMPAPRGTSAAIHRAEPKRFNDARDIGDRFKQGIPVIMNLQGADDAI